MKEHIDRVIKEQLGAYELPYDPGAWEAFSQKLGPAVTNTTTTSTQFYRKWWFAASVVTALVAAATWLGLSTGTASTPDTVAANGNEATTIESNPSGVTQPAATSSASETHQTGVDNSISPGVNQSAVESPLSSAPSEIAVNRESQVPTSIAQIVEQIKDPIGSVDEKQGSPAPEKSEGAPSGAIKSLDMPTAVCLNEQITITNPNSVEAYVKLPDGTEKRIAPGRQLSLKVRDGRNIRTVCGNLTETIVVNSPKDISIREGELTLEDGVPTVKFNVYGTQNDVVWKTEVKAKSTDDNGRTLIVHPFLEEKVAVRVSGTDNNGCQVTTTASINNPFPNLGAMNAFTPNGNIGSNDGFMPFLLKQRNTPFKLTIIDPNNSQTLFETTDVSEPWDGTDRRNGQMAKSGLAYIWRVELKKPLPMEPPVYAGTVILNN